jgi:hypothetical protein
MTRKSPQQKKQLSYERDRRNDYGDNDKASRKNIPLQKRLRARAPRRAVSKQLADALKVGPLEDGDDVEAELGPAPPRGGYWRKIPGKPLGEYLARRGTRGRSARDNARPAD